MKKLALLLVAAAGLLGLAGTAQAKEIGSLKVCGANGCNTFTDREQLKGWEPSGGQSSQPVAAPQRYYAVEMGFTDPEGSGNIIHHENAYWLPDSGLFRFKSTTDTSWWQVLPNQTAMYEKAAGAINPFTPALSKVTVKGKTAADPSSYLRLLGKFPYRPFPPGKLHLVSISLTAAAPNPWVSGTVVLRYAAKRHLLIRPDGDFRLSPTLEKLVLSRSSLKAKASTSGSGDGGTALYAGVGISVLAALAVLGIARHKKMT
jgi:hypothetical protein